LTATFILFLFSLVFAPLAFGTVEQWSLTVLELSAGTVCAIFFLSAAFARERAVKVPGLLPLLLLFCLMILQLIPLPVFLVKIISPGSYNVYSPLLSLTEKGGGLIPLSINLRATLHEMLRMGSCFLLYMATVQLLSEPQRLKKAVNGVVFLAAAIAFLAIVQAVGSPDKIYWIREVPHNAKPFGPWINPNQFAGYMELICPLAFGLFLFYKPRVREDESFRQKFVSFFTVSGFHFHLFLGFATVLMVLAVFVSLCRGGILSIVVAGAVFFSLVRWKFPGRGRTVFFVILFSIFMAISWFGWDIIISEFNHGFDIEGNVTDARITLWSDTLAIIKDFPLLGAGFGTFLSLYPMYRTIGGSAILDHAHNDYLELFTDGGVVGFFLAACFVFSVLLHGWKLIRLRRDRYAILLGIGGISGIIALLSHSITDFNMHNGAVAFYFFFICGVVVATANIRFSHFYGGSSASSSANTLLKPLSRRGAGMLALSTLLLVSLTLLVQGGAFLAWRQSVTVADLYVNSNLSEKQLRKIVEKMRWATLWDPLNGSYFYRYGTAEWYLGAEDEALSQYLCAVWKNPLEGLFLQQLGLVVEGESGKQLIEDGYSRALDKKDMAFTYTEWLLWQGRRGEAKKVLADRLSHDKNEINDWMALLNSYSFSRQDITEVLPATAGGWIQYGRYCEENGKNVDAVYFFDHATELLSESEAPQSSWFREIIHFYSRQGLADTSLAVLRRSVEMIPDSAYFHVLLGEHYREKGISYRAREEFERALVLDPENKRARRQLRRMGYGDAY